MQRGAGTAQQGGECGRRWAGSWRTVGAQQSPSPRPPLPSRYPRHLTDVVRTHPLKAQLSEINATMQEATYLASDLCQAPSGSRSRCSVSCPGRGTSRVARPVPEGRALGVPGVIWQGPEPVCTFIYTCVRVRMCVCVVCAYVRACVPSTCVHACCVCMHAHVHVPAHVRSLLLSHPARSCRAPLITGTAPRKPAGPSQLLELSRGFTE